MKQTLKINGQTIHWDRLPAYQVLPATVTERPLFFAWLNGELIHYGAKTLRSLIADLQKEVPLESLTI